MVHGKLYDNNGITYIRGFPVLTLALYPMDYLPSSLRVFYYKDIKVTFTYENGSLDNQFRRFTQEDVDYFKGIVGNPEALETYKEEPKLERYLGGLADAQESIDYVIITNERLKSSWLPLINHRENFSHLSATIVTTEEIYACKDYWNSTALYNDSPAQIREFCKDAYLDWGTQYILLGGDWDNTYSVMKVVPVRIMRVSGPKVNTIPSDLYYSNLDGTFWNQGEICWGGVNKSCVDFGS